MAVAAPDEASPNLDVPDASSAQRASDLRSQLTSLQVPTVASRGQAIVNYACLAGAQAGAALTGIITAGAGFERMDNIDETAENVDAAQPTTTTAAGQHKAERKASGAGGVKAGAPSSTTSSTSPWDAGSAFSRNFIRIESRKVMSGPCSDGSSSSVAGGPPGAAAE